MAANATKGLMSVHYRVHGKVQGVFFRKYTKQQADKLKVVGTVQNNEDGTVSGVVQGSEDCVRKMKEWLSTKGSPKSSIKKCDFSLEKTVAALEFKDFQILK